MGAPNRQLGAALFVLLWGAAVVPGVLSLRHLSWPYDPDGFRDITAAQLVLDGAGTSDPFYKGEVAWYPPLVPASYSLTSLAGGLPIHKAYILTGQWLNSLIPLAFFVCARRLVGTWPALAALCAFLFLPGRAPAWASATYSPWPFPALVAQIPFYVAVWAWVHTLEHPRTSRLLGAGILLGFTFLAHTGVGLVLAGIMFLTSCLRRPSSQRSRRSIATVLGVPCSVALPFIALLLLPIALRYRFHVFNRDPAVWAYDGAYPSVIAAGALRPSAVITLLIVVIGGLWIRRNLRPTVSIVLMSWAIVATAGLLYSVWVEQAPQWPALVSAYHFLFAVRALKWLVFGCGVIAITTATWEHFGFRSRMPVDVFCATAVLLLAVAIYPRYLGREAFRVGYEKSAHTVTADDERVYDWIRTNTDRDDVFLSSDNDALRVVGPAGRFVVSVERFFSNPYVRHEVRSADRDEMYASLLRGDRSTFEQRRERYDVQYVLARDSDIATIRQRSAEFLDLVFTSGSIAIFEVKPAAGS